MSDSKSRSWWVGAGGLALLFLSVTIQKVWSADFWWQLKNGEWIIQHHAVPTTEMFSWTAAGVPLREMRWLYCASIYEAWHLAGPWLLVLLQAALVGLTWLLVARPLRRSLSTPLGVAILALGLAAGFGRWVMRPELMTYVMAAAFLAMLVRAEKDPRWRGIWLLPFLQVLWVNTHTMFVFGPVLAWCFAGTGVLKGLLTKNQPQAQQRTSTTAQQQIKPPFNWVPIAVAALVTAACWVNPYGHGGAMYALQIYNEAGSEHATARIIMEMRSPLAIPLTAWTWDLWAAAALVALTGLTFVPVWRNVPLSRLAVWAMGAYLFCMLQRNTGLSAVLCAWAGLQNAPEIAALPAPWALKLREGTGATVAHVALGLFATLSAWYVATDRYAVRFDLPREFGLGVVEWNQPRGAADFITENKPKGNLFNIMRDGGYFVWAVSDQTHVFIDGRTDAYGPAILDELSKVNGSNWEDFAAKRAITTAVIPNRGYGDVVQTLLASKLWALVHLDSDSLIFVRRIPASEALIAAHSVDPTKITLQANPAEDAPGWKRAYGGIGRAWFSLGTAESLLAIGAIAQARPYLEQAVVKAPWVNRARAGLAPIYRAEGKVKESERLTETLSKEERAEVDFESARLLIAAGKIQDAIAPAESALAANPENDRLRIALADLYFQTSQFQRAREAYATAIKHGAGSTSELNKLGAASEQLEDWEGAVRAYRASIAIDQTQYVVWNMMGAACAQAGDLKSAGQCFENSLKIKPDFGPAARNLEKLKALQAGGNNSAPNPVQPAPLPPSPPPK